MEWKQCKIFISSTFRDMYYEREYLVKQVFYELKRWCRERRILMSEIDLRWGITEYMAREERSTILKCLNGVDDSRPFFLCFLGQYRGWVPERKEISDPTFVEYPALEAVLGKRSATEMEIYQAIDGGNAEAVFFRRDPSYLESMPPELRKVYTNEGLSSAVEREAADRAVYELAEVILPGRGYKPIVYTANFHNHILTDFRADGKPLSDRILHELKKHILSSFPDRAELPEQSDFERKLDAQAGRLFMASLEYKDRGDTTALENSFAKANGPILLRGSSGSGRSALFSTWLRKYHGNAVYRFCDRGDNLADVLEDMLIQLGAGNGGQTPLLSGSISRLERVCAGQSIIIALDGLEHFPTLEVTQLLSVRGLKLLGTIRGDCPEGQRLTEWAQGHAVGIFDTWPFTSAEDRRGLVDLYLKRYLKTLDESQMQILLKKSGTNNPLFMRIVLSELRMFGSFEGLAEFLEAFGDSVESAFTAVLERLEMDHEDTGIGSILVADVFSALAAASGGLSMSEWELASGCADHPGHLQMILRQIEPFMLVTISEGEAIYDFGYDTFRSAVQKRYSERLESMHARLCEIFKAESDPNANGRYEGSLRALQKLFFHAKHTNNASKLVSSFFYLNSRILRGGLYQLLQDLANYGSEISDLIYQFLQARAGSLAHWPDSLMSLISHEGGWFKETAGTFAGRWDMPYFDFDVVEFPGLPVQNDAKTGDHAAGSLRADSGCSSAAISVKPISAGHFSNVFATDYAAKARLIFRFERSETITVYDGDNPENEPAFIRIAKGRVSSLFVSSDGRRLAVAYESGVLSVLDIRWDNRMPSWYDTVWNGHYLRPEESRPVFLWDDNSLIFQAEDRSASRLKFDTDAPAVEEIMKLEGDVTSISVSIPGKAPLIATRVSDGGILYNGSCSQKLGYTVSCICLLEEGLAVATEDGLIRIYDTFTFSAGRVISGRMPARAMIWRDGSLYIISGDYKDGLLFRCDNGTQICSVPGCDDIFPKDRVFHIIRVGFDADDRFYCLTGESFHTVLFEESVRELSDCRESAVSVGNVSADTQKRERYAEICCATDPGTGIEAVVNAGSTLYRCTPDGLKERIDIGTNHFDWIQKDGTAIGYCRINGVGLCCFFKNRAVMKKAPEVITCGAAGDSMWLLGESGAVYRIGEDCSIDGDSGIEIVLRPPESGKPALSVYCYGNILVLSGLDTSAAHIGPRLTIYEEHGGSLRKIEELFFPSDYGHYQFSLVDPVIGKIYVFTSKDGTTTSLASGDIRGFDIRTVPSVPLPFIKSIQTAALSGGIIYIRETCGVIHAINTNGERLCSMEPFNMINALHLCAGKVFAESQGRLYKLEVKKQR